MTRLCTLFAVTLLIASCAPGLAGRWEVTGDVDQPQHRRFAGTLTVDDDGHGSFWYAFGGESREEVPLCRTERGEGSLVFVVDGNQPPSRTCESLPTPLSFSAQEGAHILTGDVTGADGNKVGRWRAFRVRE